MSARPCPCTSSAPYASCCAPFHRGTRSPPDPTALMRSRFAAFVLKDDAYLVRTLHPDHEDRARPEADVRRELRDACRDNRYMALRILDADGPDADGIARVLFAARVFHRGRDVSFVERSRFAREGSEWRYLDGEAAPMPFEAAAGLTMGSFRAS